MTVSQTEKMRKLFSDKALAVEEMEGVAGGSKATDKTADDSRFLNVLLRGRPGQCNRYGETRAGSAYESDSIAHEVAVAWKSVGIGFRPANDSGIYYWDMNTGRHLLREEAYEMAQKVVGKRLNKSDWYWD